MTSNFKNKVSRDFDKAAKNYDEHALVQRKAADKLFSMIRNDLSESKFVLDAGCGTGYFHELLRKNKIYCPLFQTDISYNMCKLSDEYGSSGKYGDTFTYQSDIESLPLAPSSIDLVFSSLTVQWTDVQKVVNQLYGILKPAGKVAIATIGKGTLNELREASLQLDGKLYINDNFVDVEYMRDVFSSEGFDDIHIKSDVIKVNHSNLKKLLTSIKGVGANYKSQRSANYLGKSYFKSLEDKYKENFSEDEQLIASWNIIYITADKPV